MARTSAADWFLLSLPAIFLGVLGSAAAMDQLPAWVVYVYGGASTVTLATYGWDKRRAHLGGWRISETTLHNLEFRGGWPGALAGQRLFRHKTRKVPFQVVFWIIVLMHLGGWGWLAFRSVSAKEG